MKKEKVNGKQGISPAETLVITCPRCHEATADVVCAKCGSRLPLTTILIQPYVQAALDQKSAVLQNREEELAQRLTSLDRLEASLRIREVEVDQVVEEKLRKERDAIAEAAAELYTNKLRVATQELQEMQVRLTAAEQAELVVRRERRALEEDKRRLELDVERRLDDERVTIRESAQKEEQEAHRHKLSEKDLLIADLRKQIDDLRRRVDQGSVQLQGEAQELELELLLRTAFPHDRIEPVPIGRAGGDVVQTVIAANGRACGKILWESKRTRTFSDSWLEKNQGDQRKAAADIGVIVTAALPRNVIDFDLVEGVWITSFRCARPLAVALRRALIEITIAKLSVEQREGAMEHMYAFITGLQFRQRICAIANACIAMDEDDAAEKRAFTKNWARRAKRRELMVNELTGLWGDLQGIAGSCLPEVAAFSVPLLTDEVRIDDPITNESDRAAE